MYKKFMGRSDKFLVGVLTALGLIGIIISITTQAPTNCWDNYQTEYDAIMHCEEH